MLHVTTD